LKLAFEEQRQAGYESGSQKARLLTEAWAASQAFCPNCGAEQLTKFQNNRPVADFYCSTCNEEFELKSQKTSFGSRIANGAYGAMCRRLAARNNPNLMLLNYTPTVGVDNLMIVPKHFFVEDVIEKRKPLAEHARRAGWIGCNILLSRIPAAGKIFIVRNKIVVDRGDVLSHWRKTVFLREESTASRGWLLNVLKCVDDIGARELSLDEVYVFETRLSGLYPLNRRVRQKIRQQLQVLRDRGYLQFLGRGRYCVI
jgi:type II restriction enzyme